MKKVCNKILIALLVAAAIGFTFPGAGAEEPEPKKYVKWAEFSVPYPVLSRALNLDIKSHGKVQLHWVEMLSYLSAKYGGNWHNYRQKDLDALAEKLRNGENIRDLSSGMKYYHYYYSVYNAVLGNFVGNYAVMTRGADDSRHYEEKYGLKVFSPIAAGYGYGHYDDFGNSRSFGFARRHEGNDLMGTVGTPVIAVEGGYIESMGWNRYGGWRIGIRTFDKKRYYYYAHLRKDHPYRTGIHQGDVVKSGDVIGYLGMTGYSDRENVNGMQKPHLHFGMQLIFDESQKDCNNEIWIDVYDIVDLLNQNRSRVYRDGSDFSRSVDFLDLRYLLYYD